MSLLYILYISLLSEAQLEIFFHFMDCLFILLMISFAVEKFFNKMRSSLILCGISCVTGVFAPKISVFKSFTCSLFLFFFETGSDLTL